MKVLYIAGPMSNIAQYNFPLFEAVATALRADGHAIVTPHECDSEETRTAAWDSPDGKHNPNVASESWGTCLARDVMMLADGFIVDVEAFAKRDNFPAGADGDVVKIDGIAFLPNWDKSKGARLEAFVGLLTGKSFYVVNIDHRGPTQDKFYSLEEVTAEWVQHMLAAPWAEGIAMHRPMLPDNVAIDGIRALRGL